MEQKELDIIIEKHKKWLLCYRKGERAVMSGADMRGADMNGAVMSGAVMHNVDMRNVDMHKANIRRADMRGADVDYSCWPLWCGSFDVRVDERIAAQLAYHFCRLDCDDADYIKARNAIIDFANQFHRVDECGRLEEIK